MAAVGVNGLYPPVFEKNYMPSFVLAQGYFRVYFSISPYNNISDIYGMCQVEVRNQKTNQSVITRNGSQILYKTIRFDQKRQQYFIEVWTDANTSNYQPGDSQQGKHVKEVDLKIDEYYKVQIRFLDKTHFETLYIGSQSNAPDNWKTKQPSRTYTFIQQHLQWFSEWSSVCLIKPISQPHIDLNGWVKNDSQEAMDSMFYLTDITLTGSIYFEDPNETQNIKSYRILLYNSQNEVLETSGTFYKNSNDKSNEFTYDLRYNFPKNTLQNYSLRVAASTDNLYKFSQVFPFQLSDTFYQQFDATISATADDKSGCAEVTIDIDDPSINISQNLVIRRASAKDNFKYWETVYICLPGSNSSQIVWRDYTIEPGVWYLYEAFLRNKKGQKSTHVRSDNQLVMIYPEDIFLTTKNYQMKVRFDPQISNFSHVISESLTPTIGSKYPFVRRNGKQNYRSFSLSGIISVFTDLRDNKMKAGYSDLYTSEIQNKYQAFNNANNITLYNDYIAQKNFRDKVLEFLYADDVKLFRSLPQGNILVKLMNVSLTPNNQLGRLIYSFSCTANEIDACTFSNYNKYNIQSIGDYNYPNANYYVKYAQLEFPSPVAHVQVTNNTAQRSRALTRSSANLTSVTSVQNAQSYMPSSPGILATLIQKKLNNNAASKEIYSVLGFKYLKIEFTSPPYPIRYDGKTYLNYKAGKHILNGNGGTKDTYMLGHLINVGGNDVVINGDGYFELSDFDLSQVTSIAEGVTDAAQYDIDSSEGVLINDFYVVDSTETGRITAIPLLEVTLKANAVATQVNNIYKIGQYWGIFKRNESLYNKLLKKYSYKLVDKNTTTIATVQTFDKVYIQAKPGTVMAIKEKQDSQENIHIINETGFLAFDSDDTSIKDIKFLGIKLRENKDTSTILPKNLNENEWYNFEDADTSKPVINGVYSEDGTTYMIYYLGNWYPFDIDTQIVECDEIEGTIDYYFRIIENIYDGNTISQSTDDSSDTSSENENTGGNES